MKRIGQAILTTVIITIAGSMWAVWQAPIASANSLRPPIQIERSLKAKAINTCYNTYKPCEYRNYRDVYSGLRNRWWQREWALRDHNFNRALHAAATHFGVSYQRLYDCASSEGGHWEWRWNHSGSGAGGWLQFMKPTFDSNVQAKAVIKVLPRAYRKFTSRAGQAYVGAYMFSIGQSHQWTGSGCN